MSSPFVGLYTKQKKECLCDKKKKSRDFYPKVVIFCKVFSIFGSIIIITQIWSSDKDPSLPQSQFLAWSLDEDHSLSQSKFLPWPFRPSKFHFCLKPFFTLTRSISIRWIMIEASANNCCNSYIPSL